MRALAATFTPATKLSGSSFFMNIEVTNTGDLPVEYKFIINIVNKEHQTLFTSFAYPGHLIGPGETRLTQDIEIKTRTDQLAGDYFGAISLVDKDYPFEHGQIPYPVLGYAQGDLFTLIEPRESMEVVSVYVD